MTYRQGRDPREVARELYEEAQRDMVASEIAHQNSIAQHAIQGFELERARHLLGHVLEIDRMKRAQRALVDLPNPEEETEDVTRARADVVRAEEGLALARTAVETCFDQKAEAMKRLRDAQAAVDRGR